jgi:glycosyltransferase involved in cell wall biosynthesis
MSLQRVLIVTETYRPEVNGVATTLGHWVDGMIRKGIEVTVIRPKQSKKDLPISGRVFEREAELLVFGLPIPGYSELKFGLASSRKLKTHIEQLRPDAVYIATEGPLGLAALRAANAIGVKAVTGFHTNFQSYSRFYSFGFLEPIITKYLRWFHNNSAGTLVPTRQQQAMLNNKGLTNIQVVSRGIDHERFSPNKRNETLRANWGVQADEPVFIYVGRIAAEKNLDLLATTYQAVCERFPDAKFVLVGDGPLKPVLSARFPNLIFAGLKRGEELAEHYASGDIFLFPSKTDTFGNVVTEAMASGCCVCAFDDAAAREHLKDRQSGFLADLGDDGQFIENAIRAYQETQLRMNIAKASHAISMKLSWDEIVQQFCTTLLHVNAQTTGIYDANRTNIKFKSESPSR